MGAPMNANTTAVFSSTPATKSSIASLMPRNEMSAPLSSVISLTSSKPMPSSVAAMAVASWTVFLSGSRT